MKFGAAVSENLKLHPEWSRLKQVVSYFVQALCLNRIVRRSIAHGAALPPRLNLQQAFRAPTHQDRQAA